jgi:osmotically-inducible protein OsmY
MNVNPTWAVLALSGLVLTSCGPSLVIGAGATVTRTVIQERSTLDALDDTVIQLGLNNQFINHSGELFHDVSTDVTEGRVVLTGSVPRREDKIAATNIAWRHEGVTEVTDELTVQEDSGIAAYAEDVWISNQIRFELLTDTKVSSVNYNVETVDTVVHITGIARSASELRQVLDVAASISGVSRVVSHVLTIDDPRRQITAEVPQTVEAPQASEGLEATEHLQTTEAPQITEVPLTTGTGVSGNI